MVVRLLISAASSFPWVVVFDIAPAMIDSDAFAFVKPSVFGDPVPHLVTCLAV